MIWARVVGAIGLGLFLLSAFTPLPNVLSRWAATLPRVEAADAIVVLGGGLWPDGSLSNASLRRAVHGITLLRKGFAPVLLLLGPGVDGSAAEAEVRAALARELGVSAGRILTEARAWTTREEALPAPADEISDTEEAPESRLKTDAPCRGRAPGAALLPARPVPLTEEAGLWKDPFSWRW